MRVAIAGSRRLPAGQAPRLLVRFLAALPDDACILLRKGAYTEPGRFEQDVENLCSVLHLSRVWCVPQPTDSTIGRVAVFLRDIDMVEHADLVLLFFALEEVEAISGTGHVMDAALQFDRPVYAYAVAANGEVTRVGDYDPQHLYADLAPSA